MNVSQAADAAFMNALRREDPKRFENLERNMRRSIPSLVARNQEAVKKRTKQAIAMRAVVAKRKRLAGTSSFLPSTPYVNAVD